MISKGPIVAPSILACDFARVGEETARMERAGADWIHCDVMDGHFVDNISFGSALVAAAAKYTALPMDVHLMIERPDHYLDRYLPHASSVTSHIEAQHDPLETLRRTRGAGRLAGISLRPATPLSSLEPLIGEFDLLLVMTVEPGFGGQSFLRDMLEKIRAADALRTSANARFLIQVDGGITPATAAECRSAGADVFVAGTSVFQSSDAREEIRLIRGVPAAES